MKNLANMMKQAQQMQSRMAEMQAKLEASTMQGQAGGGMVKVTLSGKGDLKAVSIDPSLMVADDREVLEDLLLAAHADAKQKVEAMMAEEMQKATAGMNIPGGLGGLGGLKLPFAHNTAVVVATSLAVAAVAAACSASCPASAGAAPAVPC